MEGVILKGIGGFYYVEDADGSIYECRARGLFRLDGVTPLAGDRVLFSVTGNMTQSGLYKEGFVEEILPRINAFDRPPCANVELLVLVAAARDPLPSFDVIDRFLVAASCFGAETLICVSKSELLDDGLRSEFESRYSGVYPLVFTSAAGGDGIEELRSIIRGKQVALAGASGVGKSTLTNALLGEHSSAVGDISEKNARGKNTTRHTELFDGGGFRLFDTPGFTAFDVTDMEVDDLPLHFPEFAPYLGKCRFSDCTHISEPDCALRAGVRCGRINKKRYIAFKEMYLELKERKQY